MENNKKEIIFIHMLNNFSGSPNVLSVIAQEFFLKQINTTIITSFNNKGFLSQINCSKKININYKFHNNIFLRLINYLKFQILSAIYVLKIRRNSIVYVNTILPILPAIIAKLRGNKVIYHIHEAYPKKKFLKKISFFLAEKTSTKIICVSNYVKDNISRNSQKKAVVIYNALGSNFTNKVINKKIFSYKSILMISSARKYKGIMEFCFLAKCLPQYKFTLICDANENEICSIFGKDILDIENLIILPTQQNISQFYETSDLILNLSNPKLIIETFGLTILEGMYYGLPAIVPPVGGIAELVDDGINGKKIDVNDFETLKKEIVNILENKDIYNQMSDNAKNKTKKFNKDIQINKILDEIF